VAVHAQGTAAEIVGMLSREQKTMLPLREIADHSLADVPMLAVSLSDGLAHRQGPPGDDVHGTLRTYL